LSISSRNTATSPHRAVLAPRDFYQYQQQIVQKTMVFIGTPIPIKIALKCWISLEASPGHDLTLKVAFEEQNSLGWELLQRECISLL
jgi:hypothetical protein